MIRRILFPTDYSAVANSAFPFAAMLAEACRATITALHVSTSETRGAMGSEDDFPEHAPLTVRMERAIVSKSETESYAEAIIRKARLQKCDLILMASHGRSDVAQFFLGRSVAEQVVRDSPTPSVVVRPFGSRRSTRPVVGCIQRMTYVTDLTEQSRAVLPITSDIARAMGARLDVLCAFAEGDIQPSDGGRGAAEKLIADANLTDLVDSINTVRRGIAESIVAQAAENNADLVAITSTLCSGGDPLMTKTAEYVIRHAPCPIVGVRPRPSSKDDRVL